MIRRRQPVRAAPKWESVSDDEWKEKAQCVGVMPEMADEIFFPAGGHPSERTLRVYCHQCPVLQECGDYAEKYNLEGIWGGEYRSAVSDEQLEVRRLYQNKYMRDRRAAQRAEATRLANAAADAFFAAAALDRLDMMNGKMLDGAAA